MKKKHKTPQICKENLPQELICLVAMLHVQKCVDKGSQSSGHVLYRRLLVSLRPQPLIQEASPVLVLKYYCTCGCVDLNSSVLKKKEKKEQHCPQAREVGLKATPG